ncbi:Leucine-rich repeat flightless-interacting protein 2 [Larimichthys crocea]|uniref:Leucine-rich repeat flightless-interacting protein 2 n=1 Tax=Larimichthys crocea TaxID=215358 RepID=A0A6G0HHQ3_LARCR|nr:Leucine-rich repeat flightless-interacting protein 2 [Larimichthys crocea]
MFEDEAADCSFQFPVNVNYNEELRLKKLFEERESLQNEVRLLKSQLDQRPKNGTDGVQNPEGGSLENGMDSHLLDLQRDANRQMSDLKFKLVKSEQEVTTLEQNVIRLEGQVTRYKLASENAEKLEDELKVEKRKLQRELRSALDRIDELEVSNLHLSKRLEKMKANRSALLAQQ